MSNTSPAPSEGFAHVKFENLVSYQTHHAQNGIPRKVMEYLAANKVFPIGSPPGLVGRNAQAALRSWPGLCMTISQCTPNQGPVSHNHSATLETFFCLDGEFEIFWGNDLQHKVTLKPGDLCSVPPNVYRAFCNVTDEEARLFVMIQGDKDMSDKIEMPRKTGDALRQANGDQVMDLLAAINWQFQGEPVHEPTPAHMQTRVLRAGAAQPIAFKGETVTPVLSPANQKLEGSVECWPGMTAVRLDLAPGQASAGEVEPGTCQWIVHLGGGACEGKLHGQAHVLERYGTMRLEPGTHRTVANTGERAARLMLVTQSRQVITPDEIRAVREKQAAAAH